MVVILFTSNYYHEIENKYEYVHIISGILLDYQTLLVTTYLIITAERSKHYSKLQKTIIFVLNNISIV